MIIKVNHITSGKKNSKSYFEVEDNDFKLGDIVVVENNGEDDTYGVVVKVNTNTKRQVTNLPIRVASKLDRILFWYDFEQLILKDKVKLGRVALEQYREVRKNNLLTDQELVNKMTRNLLLIHHPYRIFVTKSGALRFNYGHLQITYGSGTVHYIKNLQPTPKGWKKDWHKHWYYSKILNVRFD